MPKSKVGRKPLPRGSKRKMYSTRLHPQIIKKLQVLKQKKNKPVARVIEELVAKEFDTYNGR